MASDFANNTMVSNLHASSPSSQTTTSFNVCVTHLQQTSTVNRAGADSNACRNGVAGGTQLVRGKEDWVGGGTGHRCAGDVRWRGGCQSALGCHNIGEQRELAQLSAAPGAVAATRSRQLQGLVRKQAANEHPRAAAPAGTIVNSHRAES